MLTSNQTLGWWIQNYGSIQDSRDFGGVVPAYPIFMFIGIIAVIVATVIKMRMKKIPLNELYWAILIIVPIGIIGGTIFGKAFLPDIKWYETLEFWNPGMSLFGAIGLGTVGGFVWFYKRSKVTQISVWVYADCILPNVLLGQAIGRWGNMYNHEILGNVVSYDSLQWLVPGIRDKLFYWEDAGNALLGVNLPNDWARAVQYGMLNDPKFSDTLLQPGHAQELADLMLNDKWLAVYEEYKVHPIWTPDPAALLKLAQVMEDPHLLKFREPLFLYESLGNTALWLILTFIVPNLSRWIQPKGKYPWDITPNAYPGWYNPKVKSLSMDDIESWSVQRPIKYKKSADGKYTISFWEAWNKAYYLYEPNSKEIDELVLSQDNRIEHENRILESLDNLHDKYRSDLYRYNENFERKTNIFSKKDSRYIKLHDELLQDVKSSKIEYKKNKKELLNELGGWRRYFKPVPDAEKLEELNNPNHFFVLRSGVLSGAYVLGYMIIRIILETHRKASELFVQNYPVPDYIVLGIILAAGLAIILIAQLVSPYKYREVGWLYEKSY